ncbi:hypothetical protein IG631_11747 [Alternaria alternata]|nr:hypothetical protein IG631_11747 [Alternaria alternata]
MAVKEHASKEAAMGLLAPSGADKSIDGGRSVDGVVGGAIFDKFWNDVNVMSIIVRYEYRSNMQS